MAAWSNFEAGTAAASPQVGRSRPGAATTVPGSGIAARTEPAQEDVDGGPADERTRRQARPPVVRSRLPHAEGRTRSQRPGDRHRATVGCGHDPDEAVSWWSSLVVSRRWRTLGHRRAASDPGASAGDRPDGAQTHDFGRPHAGHADGGEATPGTRTTKSAPAGRPRPPSFAAISAAATSGGRPALGS